MYPHRTSSHRQARSRWAGWLAAHLQELIVGGLAAVFVAIVLYLSWGLAPKTIRKSEYCFVKGSEKIAMDKAFTPLHFVGLVTSMEKMEFPGKVFRVLLYLDILADSATRYGPYRGPDFQVDGLKPAYVGVRDGISSLVNLGDTVRKTRGTYTFRLLRQGIGPLRGDTLLLELSGPGKCWDGDCTYRREGSLLCGYN